MFSKLELEGPMAPHSSTLAWKIPWTEEPGRLQSLGSRRVRHDWATSLSLFTFMHWRRKWQPAPVFLPGESQGRGAWWAVVYGVAQSRTQLKWLSSSSSRGSSTVSRQPLTLHHTHPDCIIHRFHNEWTEETVSIATPVVSVWCFQEPPILKKWVRESMHKEIFLFLRTVKFHAGR